MKNKSVPLFKNELEIDKDTSPHLFDIAEIKPERLEKHLVGLAKTSYNIESPTQRQIASVATILENDLGFEM